MARAKKPTTGKKKKAAKARRRPVRWLLRWAFRGCLLVGLVVLSLVALFSVVNPPLTHTIWSERQRLGTVRQTWVALEDVAPVMARAVVAAEDAKFCLHWGFDVDAIRTALAEGSGRGGSTVTQQVVKNVFLWQGRSWVRKAMEAAITPLVEAVWSKRRIVEVYLNVAEMGPGVFGVSAAARHWYGVDASRLTPTQAARIAAILPSPRKWSASKPTSFIRKRSASIVDGAATIKKDGRAACFED
jgi:monofunctional biosynthetic peptidoglycan transglycosylase